MKNLLIYIHPSKKFKTAHYPHQHKEMEFLAKVQIDNSIAFGWDRKDIMVVTNFPYEYNGVQALVIPDDTFSEKKRTVSKINAILVLFEMGLITDEVFWFHDFDAFQNTPMGKVELGDKQLALTHTSINDERFSTGVMFFSKQSKDIFTVIQAMCKEHVVNEEMALRLLLRKNREAIMDKFLVLNLSYNFAIRKRDVAGQYTQSDKPLKVLHFHPYDNRFCSHEFGKTSLDVVYGNNSIGATLISDRLKTIFNKHGL